MEINSLALTDKPKSRNILDLWLFATSEGHSIKEAFQILRKRNSTIPYDHIRYWLLEWSVHKDAEGLALLATAGQSIASVRSDLRKVVGEMEARMAAKAIAAKHQAGEFIGADVGEDPSFLSYSASVWSSPTKRNDLTMLPARLANAYFLDLLDLSLRHGIDHVSDILESIKDEMQPVQYKIEREMLYNIIRGFTDT